MSVVLEAKHINKYFRKPVTFQVLKDVNFKIEKGEFVSIMGKSGCGKSTLLYILSTMDTDYEGELFIHEELITGKPDKELAQIRNENIGQPISSTPQCLRPFALSCHRHEMIPILQWFGLLLQQEKYHPFHK